MKYLSDEINMDDEFDYLGETYFNPLKESVYDSWWDNTQGEWYEIHTNRASNKRSPIRNRSLGLGKEQKRAHQG